MAFTDWRKTVAKITDQGTTLDIDVSFINGVTGVSAVIPFRSIESNAQLAIRVYQQLVAYENKVKVTVKVGDDIDVSSLVPVVTPPDPVAIAQQDFVVKTQLALKAKELLAINVYDDATFTKAVQDAQAAKAALDAVMKP